jgi:hypothetical protein
MDTRISISRHRGIVAGSPASTGTTTVSTTQDLPPLKGVGGGSSSSKGSRLSSYLKAVSNETVVTALTVNQALASTSDDDNQRKMESPQHQPRQQQHNHPSSPQIVISEDDTDDLVFGVGPFINQQQQQAGGAAGSSVVVDNKNCHYPCQYSQCRDNRGDWRDHLNQTVEQQQQQQQQEEDNRSTNVPIANDIKPYVNVVCLKNVRFSYVTIRNYDITMSDNPAVTAGPPIQLDWGYEQLPLIPIREFEEFRIPRRMGQTNRLFISPEFRRGILLRAGFTDQQIDANDRIVAKVQKNRSLTCLSFPFYRVEYAVRSAGRKIQRKTEKSFSRSSSKNRKKKKNNRSSNVSSNASAVTEVFFEESSSDEDGEKSQQQPQQQQQQEVIFDIGSVESLKIQ